jgi:hypothetical protein
MRSKAGISLNMDAYCYNSISWLRRVLTSAADRMRWLARDSDKRTYYCLGWSAHDAGSGVFRDVTIPGGGSLRVMDKYVHQAALDSAGKKLRELSRASGKHESSV